MPIVTPPKPPAPLPTVPAPTYPTGGQWAGTAPRPPVTNYPTATQQLALNQKNMPAAWGNWFAQVAQPLDKYYTPEMGGADQATRDYYGFQNYWQQQTGRPLTTEDMMRFMNGFQGYAARLGRKAMLSDVYDYAGKALAEPVRPPQVSYLKMGEW